MMTTPPTSKAIPTGNSFSGNFQCSLSKISPPTAVIPNASATFFTYSRAAASCAASNIFNTRSLNNGITATTAELWITMLKRSDCRGNHFSAINRCPVEDMGRNSVIPSMIPKKIIASQSGTRCTKAKIRLLTSNLFPSPTNSKPARARAKNPAPESRSSSRAPRNPAFCVNIFPHLQVCCRACPKKFAKMSRSRPAC